MRKARLGVKGLRLGTAGRVETAGQSGYTCYILIRSVSYIGLDGALNLLWLGISVAALVYVFVLEWRRFRYSPRRARFRRLFAVGVVSMALFPSVSDSDDLFNFSLMQAPLGHQSGVGNTPPEDSREKPGVQLANWLQTLDHYRVANVYTFAPALCFVAVLLSLRLECFTRAVRCRSGRAPPFASSQF